MFISVLKVFLGREFRNRECFGRGSDFPEGVLNGHDIKMILQSQFFDGCL